MPFPIAHGLLGATVVVALVPSKPHRWKFVIAGAILAVSPDFDYALNWLRISGGGWHHGFTHSIVFACVLGLTAAIVIGERTIRSILMFICAIASHTLLDFVMTESRGVALWWPFTDKRYKLMAPNPIDYSWSDSSFWAIASDVVRICLTELIIFAPLFLAVLLVRRLIAKRHVSV